MKLFISIIVMFTALLSLAEMENHPVVEKVEEINTLRETLVKGVSGTTQVTPPVFKAVCKPVGMRAKAIAKENGWKFRQASEKYRNPNHKPTALELEAIKRFEKESLTSFFETDKSGNRHYFRRITVQKACLACHGPKDKRPEFIKNKFPQDKAFGFKEGDLRGIYHVEL